MFGRRGKYEGRDESQKSSHPNKQRNKTQNKTETPKGTRPVSINATFFKGSLELKLVSLCFIFTCGLHDEALTGLTAPQPGRAREKRDRRNNTERQRNNKKYRETPRQRGSCGLLSRPTLKLLHLFTVQSSSELQPQSTTRSPFKVRVIDCRGKRRCTHPSPSLRRAARWSEPNTPSLLAHPCSTCTPHMSRAGNTTAQRHLVGTSLKHNLHFSKRRCHTSPTPPTRQTTPQAEYLHNTVRYIWNYTHTLKNENANTLSEAGSRLVEPQVGPSAVIM